jgi:hypothetical protein
MTTKILKSLTIAALFVSSAAFADQSIQISSVNGKQEARFSIGDSKCVLVGEVIRCVPMVVASK